MLNNLNISHCYDVVIIGAGISGLACAQALKNAGKNVLVLEAKERIGGRLHSINYEDETFDLGASWIHGIDNNPIWEIAQNNEIETAIFNYIGSDFFHENGQVFTAQEKQEFVEYIQCIEKLFLESKQDSAQNALNDIFNNLTINSLSFSHNQLKKLLYSYFERFANDPFATELNQLSTQFQKYEGYFNGDEVIFPQGYSQILSTFCKDIAIEKNIQVNQMVLENNAVKIIDANDREYLASKIVVSVSLGVLKKNLIQFVPELPQQHQNAISKMGFGSFNKVFFELEDSLNLQANSNSNSFYYWVNGTWFNILDLSKIYNKPIYLMLFGGAQSEFIDKTTDVEVWDFIYKNLNTSLINLPIKPKRIFITRWGADEFNYGSFSFPAIGHSESLVATLNEPVEDRIFFTGEHCSLEYAGTVHGAYLNGLETAEKI
ncbi:NAD(P)/FAD-dependent oxidoreductase [Acinetobacter faecalis]|uniref:Tryptophan 2-monooxygenase n=1 Tax=Acinetobacter faecalis TaxID=2665161 RepID=A0AB35UY42_9GAMM|nr:NAD(P)/FAD-dependent oxidoreductase [Acinetobacter faecalis]MDY6487360.1 NAD(P)/FAD-dependent oxidoreductase [Acinetobacter faecalis]